MPHPHQSFLDEFNISIKHLVPLTPDKIVVEAKSIHKELSEDEKATEKQIHQALSLVGKKEYPYRKAYTELCQGDEEQRLQKEVFERIDPSIAKKILEMTRHGVMLEEYMRSDLFEEQLEPDERYQLEQAILLADEVLDNQCEQRAENRKVAYEDLVKVHKERADLLQGKIDQLRAMGEGDAKWEGEINTIADRLEEGWSVVERDTNEEEVLKEIEYWNTVLHEDDEV